MDPISALSLAGNIITFVQFGSQIVGLCRKVHNGQQPLEDIAKCTEDFEEALKALTVDLEDNEQNDQKGRPDRSKDDLQSAIGLFRSILYGVLDKHPSLVSSLVFDEAFEIMDWTERRVLLLLNQALTADADSRCFCFFVDALDKLDGEIEELLQQIKQIAELRNVKVCLTSRSELVIRHALKGQPSLNIQSLTYDDIACHVDESFKAAVEQHEGHTEWYKDCMLRDLKSELVDAVFLWVKLALGSVRQVRILCIKKIHPTQKRANNHGTHHFQPCQQEVRPKLGILSRRTPFIGFFKMMAADMIGREWDLESRLKTWQAVCRHILSVVEHNEGMIDSLVIGCSSALQASVRILNEPIKQSQQSMLTIFSGDNLSIAHSVDLYTRCVSSSKAENMNASTRRHGID
ncbi:MAG: hypothetical protein Q9162_003649 [Coniocarpon cinnabarinum]